MNAAHAAKGVLRDVGIERVGRKVILAAEQLKLLPRHDEVEDALFAANGAVAFRDLVEIGSNAETHAPAVTPALHYAHGGDYPTRASGCEGSGTSISHSLAASIQDEIASWTFFSASSGVAPSDM